MNILIVDDSKMNIRIAEDALNEFNVNGTIFSSLSGEEAIDFVENQPVDLILLDIVMPGITGIDFLSLANERGLLNKAKVIMLTTVDDLEILKKCFELGATDYIHKPFNKIEFVVRVKAALSEAESEKNLKRALELLENQNAELRRINKALKDTQAYVIAKEKMTAIGSLINGLTQEIDVPLTNLEQIIETCNENSTKFERIEEYDQYAKMNGEITNVRKIINALKELTSENKQEQFTYAKLSELVEEVLMLLGSELKKVTKITKSYQDVGLVYCNVNSFKQSLMHIIVNAIYAMRDVDESEILIKTLDVEGASLLIIEDNGEGLSSEALSNIFDPFFTTKPRQHFMGLGLSVVHDIIVNKHGGSVNVDCLDGKTSVSISMNRKK